jgi:hypothetical protein
VDDLSVCVCVWLTCRCTLQAAEAHAVLESRRARGKLILAVK